jgi:hypothetical protein
MMPASAKIESIETKLENFVALPVMRPVQFDRQDPIVWVLPWISAIKRLFRKCEKLSRTTRIAIGKVRYRADALFDTSRAYLYPNPSPAANTKKILDLILCKAFCKKHILRDSSSSGDIFNATPWITSIAANFFIRPP